jgi:hypothetical protein
MYNNKYSIISKWAPSLSNRAPYISTSLNHEASSPCRIRNTNKSTVDSAFNIPGTTCSPRELTILWCTSNWFGWRTTKFQFKNFPKRSTYVHGHPLFWDRQVLVLIWVPHMPHVSLHVPWVHDDHCPPGGHVVPEAMLETAVLLHIVEPDGVSIGSVG